MIKKIYRSLNRTKYLLNKLILSFSKKLVIYTKRHPIFTSVFEDSQFDGFVFACIDIRSSTLTPLEKFLMARAVLIHADATAFPNPITDKKMVVECEGRPEDSFFTYPHIKKILVESRSAGVHFLGHNDKVALCYPSINIPDLPVRVAKKQITILCVGHGGLLKGYDVVYRLFNTLNTRYNIKLIIAGSMGHNFQYYPELTKDTYDRADFTGILKELSEHPNVVIQPFKREELLRTIYKDADIYLHLSRMETFGYSILEAMSFGLPVVSCQFKAISEMIQDGHNGYLVKSNGYDTQNRDYIVNINSMEWADNCYSEALEYISGLIENDERRQTMGKNALMAAKQQFNMNDKITFLNKLYSDIIDS